ncbi:MAG: helix-turn-helix domain-containing protein [Planctomycetes bacterium]|nr:helix-turn-helix domain-containing protein [Planctomycetota bacterium]
MLATAWSGWRDNEHAIMPMLRAGKSLNDMAAALGYSAWRVRSWLEYGRRTWIEEGRRGKEVDALAAVLADESPAANHEQELWTLGHCAALDEGAGEEEAEQLADRFVEHVNASYHHPKEDQMPKQHKQSPLPLPVMNFGADGDRYPCKHGPQPAAGYPQPPDMMTFDPDLPWQECNQHGTPVLNTPPPWRLFEPEEIVANARNHNQEGLPLPIMEW